MIRIRKVRIQIQGSKSMLHHTGYYSEDENEDALTHGQAQELNVQSAIRSHKEPWKIVYKSIIRQPSF